MYSDNLRTARQNLQDSELFKSVLERARKKNRLDIAMTGSEKYNWPDHTGQERPNISADGSYDVEGHTWTDINGFTTVYLWRWPDLKRYVSNIFSWVKDCWEVFSIKSPQVCFKFAWDTLPFHTTWEQWVWTVESLDVAKSDLVEEKLMAAHEDNWRSYVRSGNYMKEYDKMSAATGRQEVLAYADKEYLRVTEYMWVGRNDSTVILVDEVRRPFDYKNGWSNLMIASIIWDWAKLVAGYWGVVKTDTGIIKSFDPIKKDILRGMTDIEQGRLATNEEVGELLGEKKEDSSGQAQGN